VKLRSIFFGVALLFCGVLKLTAQTTVYWYNFSAGNWSVNANWYLNPPGPLDTAVFQNSTTYSSTVDTNFTIANLQFGANQGAMTLTESGSSVLTVTGTVSYGTNNNVTINVPLAGSGNVWLNGGGGTLTLNPIGGPNTYSGSTEVFAGGTLSDGGANSYSANSTMYIGGTGGGTLDVNHNETVQGLNDGGNNGVVNIAAGATLIVSGIYTDTFSGIILGSGNLEKDGSSTLSLAGPNIYPGTTVIGPGSSIWLIGPYGSLGSSGISGAGGISFNNTTGTNYSGVISGSISVNENGGGGVTNMISGNNTYSGATTVLSGTLAAGSTSAFGGASGDSDISVSSGATLSLNGFNNSIGRLTGSGTVALGSGTLTFVDTVNFGNFSGSIMGTGGIVYDGYQGYFSGSNTYTGGTTINSGSLVADNTAGFAFGGGSILVNPGGTLQVGSNDNGGILNSGALITNNGTLTFFQNSSAYTFGNNIAGTGIVSMNGYGTEKLTGNNTYTGETSVFRGTLQAGSATAFGSMSDVVFSFNGVLDLNNYNITVGSISGSATTGGILLTGTSVLTIANSLTNPNFAAPITGTGSLVLGGTSGSLTLDGTGNTYSGGTTVNSGTLLIANPSGYATGTGPITIGPAGTLFIGADYIYGFVDPSSTITDNGILAFSRSDNPSFLNTVTGTGGVNVLAGGVTFLNGNLYSGFTEVEGGTLTLDNTAGYATGTGSLLIDSGAFLQIGNNDSAGAIDPGSAVIDNGLIVFNRNSLILFPNTISGSGSVTLNGAGNVLVSGANSYGGTTTIAHGSLTDGNANAFSPNSDVTVGSSGNLTVTYDETVNSLQSGGAGSVDLQTGATLTSLGNAYGGDFPGSISGGGGIEVTSNQQGFSGNNAYSGGTTISGTGEVWVGSNTALGSGPITFNGSDTELSPDANLTMANPIVVDSTFDNDDGNFNLTLTGVITGPAGIEWGQPSILALTNSGNSFMNGVDMREGTLLLGSDTAAGPGDITLDTGTILSAYGGPGVVRNIPNDIDITGSYVQFGNNDNDNITLSGTFGGESSVTYNGGSAGTFTLTGDNSTFSGPFTIASGTVIDASNSAFGSSGNIITLNGGVGLTVNSGITVNNPLSFGGTANVLSGSGTIGTYVTADSTVVISPSAAPGGGPGTLNFADGLNLTSGGAIHFDIHDAMGAAGTGYSLISASSLILSASANSITFNIVSTDAAGNAANAINFNSATPYSWTFASSSTAIVGTFDPTAFNLITSGFTNSTGTGSFNVSESGNNLLLNFTPVPEPSTWCLMGAGVLAIVPYLLRRRKWARA
jgi:fibronectin-binding autotransporter adhesin